MNYKLQQPMTSLSANRPPDKPATGEQNIAREAAKTIQRNYERATYKLDWLTGVIQDAINAVNHTVEAQPASEWTARAYGPNDECVQIGGLTFKVNISATLVADAINAALAALDKQLRDLTRTNVLPLVKELEKTGQQLAAERQRAEEINQLTGQVALMTVERNEARNVHMLIAQKRRTIEELQRQLAAERARAVGYRGTCASGFTPP